ncbi:hypothetical protein M438DRAFT_344862 [Aureobasidium pullulans EXF-150]|uniref:Uncharacterized protein n=1 Tax=Aureobasidium pullulans EXF-150 TaxID=1043002 RepID=A0A074XJ64_AURPU|nr:uncharacterized protein M438DRAFT_344862 [Aureobasidium pullulans EXF-150]KEQ85558.1 hypothetical protein M438DRAFT_344862 [Aureobasidium pullulans EXF-150]
MRAAGSELSILLSNCRFLIGLYSCLLPCPILLYTSRLLSGCARGGMSTTLFSKSLPVYNLKQRKLRWMVGARSRDCVTRRRPSMVNVLGCIDEASLLNEDSNATCHFQINTLLGMLSPRNIPINIARHVVQSLFLSSQKVKSRFLAHNMTLLSFSRPGFSSGD